jgi:mRNA interferase MazF
LFPFGLIDILLELRRTNTVAVNGMGILPEHQGHGGNALLDVNEAGLPKQSVIVASQISKVDATQLGEFIGTLTEQRIQQVLAGIRFLQTMTQHHE